MKSENQEITLDLYHKKSSEYGMCKKYVLLWDECDSISKEVNLAFGAQGMDFFMNSVAQGWGMSSCDIKKHFRNYINGNYVCKENFYSSELYCRFKGCVTFRTTAMMVIDSDIDIFIPDYLAVVRIYISGKCRISLKGKASCTIVSYGDTFGIDIDEGNCRVKYINKKEAENHERV